MTSSFKGLMNMFRPNPPDRQLDISGPTNVVRHIHVGKNAHGELEGKTFFASNYNGLEAVAFAGLNIPINFNSEQLSYFGFLC